MKYFISSLFFISIIFAQWSTNPSSPQSLGSGVQAQLAATSDGGVYIAWLSDGNNYQVFLQRLNSMGEPQLSDNGMVVSNNANASWIAVYHLNLAVDNEDNAIITTMDQRAGGAWEVYAYKISSDGTMLWGNDGVSLTSSSVSNMSPRLTVLSDNSAVVTWTHNDDTVLFQRISSDGTLLWDTGILIEDNDATLISPKPIVTSDGNVLIQWIRQTGPFWASNSQLYLQKYDYDGTAEWSNPVVAAGPVVFPMGNWLQQSVADDISGSFSAWTEMSGNVQNARAQHINDEGELSWTGGVDLSTNSSNFRISPQLTFSENSQELMAVWKESNGSQSQRGVSAQRLDSNGDRLWGSNGTSVVDLNSNYDYLDLNIAGFGDDLIATYIEQSGNMNGNIYAVRLDVNGDNVWTGGTVAVTNSNTSKSDMMITNGPGCVFIAWTEGGSIYVHCLLTDGTLGVPIPPLLVPSEYPTIQAAIDSASDGETVLVAAGTYVENIDFNGKNIVITSTHGADSTIIDGDQNARVVLLNRGTIHGFTITNGLGGIDSDGGQIVNCLIINNSLPEDGWYMGGGIYASHSGTEDTTFITNVTITQNSAHHGGGIMTYNQTIVVIKNSIIRGNETVGFGENITPIQNEIDSEDWAYIINYSNITGWSDDRPGEGNIDADPLFCDPNSSDYNLAENSLCVGTAENGANMGAFGVGCGPIHVGPVWYVATTGSDSTGNGSEDFPFATIQHGIDESIDGDSVLVAAGTYVENINYNGKKISIIGEDRETTIIDANGAQYGVVIDSSALLKSFTIQNASGGTNDLIAGGIVMGGNATLDDLIVQNNQAGGDSEGLGFGGGVIVTGSGILKNSILRNSTGPSDHGELCVANGTNEFYEDTVTVENCLITSFSQGGCSIQFKYGTPRLIVKNCTAIGLNGHLQISGGYASVNNSIIFSNDYDPIYGDEVYENLIITNSNITNGYSGEGNIDIDPLFCEPDSGDYTLAENSPCVGTGENGANMGAFGVGCGIQVDWDFSLSEPVIEVMGTDNVWNPGDTISVEMDFCNNTDVAHNWYPGVTIESDSSLTSLHSGHIWFYAMVADECHTISWGAIANTSVISDTVVTFSAYPEALNCQNQPEYCIDGDTLTFEVPIVVQVVSAVTESFAPEQFSLHQNYPNPFNPVTTLRYDLPENSLVNITIYDMMGRGVKTLVNQSQDAGYRSVVWDATNDYGKPVSAGIYLYQIQAGKHISTKKMVLLK
jgi:hypothetical protein